MASAYIAEDLAGFTFNMTAAEVDALTRGV
jgi:hypothetical protein